MKGCLPKRQQITMHLLRRCMCRRKTQRRQKAQTTAILQAMRGLPEKSTIQKGNGCPSRHRYLLNQLKPNQQQFTAFHIISKKLSRKERVKVCVKIKPRLQMRTRAADKLLCKMRPLREIEVRRWERLSPKPKWQRSYLSSVPRPTFLPLAKQTSKAKRASRS